VGTDNGGHAVHGSTVVALMGLGATLACGLLAVCATLFAADKMPLAYFYVSVAASALVLAGFGALACFLWKGWLGKAWHIPSGYLWSAFFLLIAVSLPVTAAAYGGLLVLELSVVPLVFMIYLLQRTLLRRVEPGRPWEYHFIEHLSDQSTMVRADRGSVVMKVRNAKSLTVLRQAIFEHPPANDDTIIQFSAVGIGMHIEKLRLEGSYGILEEFEDEDDQLKVSEFPTKSGNRVRFQVWVNERSILTDDRDDFGWTAIECQEPLRMHQERLQVELRTNCLGDPSWNWAAWGELKLVEWN
jgi:hypothetical protein